MKEFLNISIVQPDVFWEDIEANLLKYTGLVESQRIDTDLIVFPEMFTTGFSVKTKSLAEEKNGLTEKWMKEIAGKHHCSVAGSIIAKEDGRFYNRLIYATEAGDVYYYDKRHLFGMAGEEANFTQGNHKLITDLYGWRISFQICYDLRFPVWSRNCNDYDVLVNVANWPEARRDAWNVLLKARALENQSYVVGVNRVGTDGNDISYTGESMIIDAKGRVLENLSVQGNIIANFSLSSSELNDFRKKFPVWRDWDKFTLEDK